MKKDMPIVLICFFIMNLVQCIKKSVDFYNVMHSIRRNPDAYIEGSYVVLAFAILIILSISSIATKKKIESFIGISSILLFYISENRTFDIHLELIASCISLLLTVLVLLRS